jgi:hypothetical protein
LLSVLSPLLPTLPLNKQKFSSVAVSLVANATATFVLVLAASDAAAEINSQKNYTRVPISTGSLALGAVAAASDAAAEQTKIQ